jgi:dTDP-4-amino-4,6-dideoxygalactose transaminase
MVLIGTVPRRSVNLPGSSLFTILGAVLRGQVRGGDSVARFERAFGDWLGVPHVFGAASGRSAFQLALEALALPAGSEVVFPVFTFPVMPMVAKLLGLVPRFADVDPVTYNSEPEHIEAVLTPKTGAVFATHLFGMPCRIAEIAELCRARGIRLLEDCAHACGVRVGDRKVGTFGDVGCFSFAEGKNMPCLGGGAIAVRDDEVAERARRIHAQAPIPSAGALLKDGLGVWTLWLVTRPWVFGLTAYQAIRLQAWRNRPLLDSAVGDELLAEFAASRPQVRRLGALQASVGLRQLRHIDAFNEGARRNARILTEALGEVPGVRVPPANDDNIYVYYPLTVAPEKREDLRLFLLRAGIDSKHSDMADCSALRTFGGSAQKPPAEASILEICVYPSISGRQMLRIARAIRAWAGLPEAPAPGAQKRAPGASAVA